MNINDKKKMFVTIFAVIMIISATVGVTYAVFTWRSSNTDVSGLTECLTVHYTKGQNITAADAILFDESLIIRGNSLVMKEGMAFTNVETYLDSSCGITADLAINLTVNSLDDDFISGDSAGAFKYAVVSYNPSTYTSISIDNLKGKYFPIVGKGSITNITGEYQNPITLVNYRLTNTNTGYLIVFYIDGDLANNGTGEANFSGTISAVATQVME